MFDSETTRWVSDVDELAAADGGSAVRFSRPAGSAINVLDPQGPMTFSEDGDARLDRLLAMVETYALGRQI